MTAMMNYVSSQKQQKKCAEKQRIFVMPLWVSGTGWKSFAPPGDTD